MSHELFQLGKAALEFSRRMSENMFNNIPEDKRLHQPCNGGNHAIWVMGHIACTDDFFLKTFAQKGSDKGDAYSVLFGMKSSPSSSAEKYPSYTELRKFFDERRAALLGWFESLDEKSLRQSLPKDFQMFARTNAELMSSIATHEGFHAGQVSVARKSLGLAPVFG